MAKTSVISLDLNFQNRKQAIASYLIRHSTGAALVECGPGSCHAALEAGLAKEGLSPHDITHVFLTHIHLDHAGAAGWWSQQGAQIIVHPVGAPHLLDPQKLLASATRIYGERMESLWGQFLPVAGNSLRVAQDAEEIVIGNLRIVALHTLGHAEHHICYLFEDVCFTGDVGGVRIPGYPYLRAPMPPPELNIEKWRESLARLRKEKIARIAPTHFGIFDDPEWHFSALEHALDSAARWLEETMPADPPVEAIRQSFSKWMIAEGMRMGLSEDVARTYEVANPSGMSADGLQRYWKKVKMASAVFERQT